MTSLVEYALDWDATMTMIIRIDGIMKHRASQRNVDSQKLVAPTPAMNCDCLALIARSVTTNTTNVATRKAIPNETR